MAREAMKPMGEMYTDTYSYEVKILDTRKTVGSYSDGGLHTRPVSDRNLHRSGGYWNSHYDAGGQLQSQVLPSTDALEIVKVCVSPSRKF